MGMSIYYYYDPAILDRICNLSEWGVLKIFKSTLFKIIKLVAFGVVPYLMDMLKDYVVDKGTTAVNNHI